jgi:hypothetical protein
LAALLIGVALAGPAVAQDRYAFHVDPAQSFIRIEPTSVIGLGLPGPLGVLGLPLVAQSDPSTTGNVVPGIGSSDGTRTALAGAFVVDLSLPPGQGFTGQISSVAAPPLITLVDSGDWLPGNGSGPFAGDLAAEIGFSSLGLVGEIVLRNLSLAGFDGGGVSFVSADAYTFPAQPFSLDPEIRTQVASGSVAFQAFGGFAGGLLLREGNLTIPVPADIGTLTRVGADDWLLAITFTTPLVTSPRGPGPIGVDIDITTTIVATTVPEPGPATGFAATLAALAFLGWRRRAGRRDPVRWSALWLVAFAVLPACLQPVSIIPDANGDAAIDASEAAVVYREAEGDGSTTSAANDSIALGITEVGQAPQDISCTGDCPGISTPFSLSSGCGTVEAVAKPTGFAVEIASDCAATSSYSANVFGTQSAFNMSSVGKSFSAILRVAASDPTGIGLLITVDGNLLTPNVPLPITLPGPFDSAAVPFAIDVSYTADSGDAEFASFSIEFVPTRPTCENGLECGVGRACLAGTCADSGFDTVCFNSADCVEPFQCIGSLSRCREPLAYPDPCSSEFDCAGSCISGQCSDGLIDQPCDDDDDCDTSAPVCASGFCSP